MRRSYAFIILSSAGVACFSVVDVVYFTAAGYTLAFVGLMTAAFNLAVAASELPFAVLFDRYSNKLALQAGNLIRMVAFALFFLNLDPGTLVLAQVLAGLGVAATSGTANALVVNEIQTRSADVMARAFGRISYLVAGAGIVGGVIGVLLYSVEPRAIWLGAIGFFLAAAIVILGFRDTRAERTEESWREYGRKVVRVVRMPAALLLVLANASAVAPFLLWQVKFDSFSLLFVLVGYLILNAAGLLGPLLMARFRVRTAHLAVVALANVVAVVAFGLATEGWVIAVSFFVHVMLHVVLVALASGLFHAGVDNSVRATAGSAISLADSLVVAGLAPLVGWIGQSFGLAWGIAVSCVTYALVALLALSRRNRAAARAEDAAEDAAQSAAESVGGEVDA
ncbi:MFS transporter [Schumannella luteola]